MKKLLLILLILSFFAIVYLVVYGYGWCGGFVGKECPAGFWCRTTNALIDEQGKCVFNPFIK